jgi:NADH-quinone oxidoreductase subunit H
MRYDQFMHFGWKVLIPVNLVWILAITTVRVLRDQWGSGTSQTIKIMAIVLVPILIGLAIYTAVDLRRVNRLEAETAAEEEAEAAKPFTFPIPPMDLKVPASPRLVNAAVTTPAVTAGLGGRGFAETPAADGSDSSSTNGGRPNG